MEWEAKKQQELIILAMDMAKGYGAPFNLDIAFEAWCDDLVSFLVLYG